MCVFAPKETINNRDLKKKKKKKKKKKEKKKKREKKITVVSGPFWVPPPLSQGHFGVPSSH